MPRIDPQRAHKSGIRLVVVAPAQQDRASRVPRIGHADGGVHLPALRTAFDAAAYQFCVQLGIGPIQVAARGQDEGVQEVESDCRERSALRLRPGRRTRAAGPRAPCPAHHAR